MRKEVYKRKPKKAFENIEKPKTPPPCDGSNAGYEASKTYRDIRFKPAYKRGWFWVLTLIFLTLSTYFYLDNTVFEERRQQEALIVFESTGIRDYYFSNKERIDSIAQFIRARNGKIWSIERSWYGKMTLYLRSENYDKVIMNREPQRYHYFLTGSNLKPEVIEGKLKYYINDAYRFYEEYWTCAIELENIRDIDITFINYLETDYNGLDGILRKAAATNFSINESSYGIIFEFERNRNTYGGDRYMFLLSNHPDSLIRPYSTTPVKLADGVYWSKN